ncbi:Rhodanese-like domain-containing protein [Geopyxis carbonaria]|nr:Rhodanese-like domain-containing protein [Geopyxis carbonaria]
MSTSTEPAASAPAPWHASLPAPVSTPVFIPRSTLLPLLSSPSSPPSYILVDLRRTDHTGGTIATSLNLPAQSLHASLPTLYKLAKAAGVAQVIFYCGSSRGRGSRAAAWLQDYINEVQDKEMKSVALEGGIKGWVKAGEEYVKLVDGYVESEWKGEGGCE